MKRSKTVRVLAIIAIVLLVVLYLSSLVFALLNDPVADGLLKASFLATIALPVLLYVYTLMFKYAKQRKENRETGFVSPEQFEPEAEDVEDN